METMKKNKTITTILITAMAALLVACGPSDEKLAQANEARSLLVSAKEAAEQTYLDITDDSQRKTLDELAAKEAEIEALDFTKMNDKNIDEALPGIKELTDSYQNLGKELSDTLDADTKVRNEKAKHIGLDTYFINKTGMNLSSIVLHDITADTYSDNLVGDDVVLQAGYTLMGTSLDIYADSREWEFVITDDAGTEYNISCEDLKGKELTGVSIVLSYDSKEGTGEAITGGYIPEPAAPAEDEAAEGASEGASGEGEADASDASSASSSE